MPKFEDLLTLSGRFPIIGQNAAALKAYLGLMETALAVEAMTDRNLGRFGLGQARFSLLGKLWHNMPEPMTPTELSEACGVSKGVITGLLDGLERDGYLSRGGRGKDRRVTPITISEKGRELVEGIVPEYLRWISGLVEALDPREQAELARLLGKVQVGREGR